MIQFGRIHQETKSFDGRSYRVGYTYDTMGRTTGVTYPTGQTVSYSYNKLGQLTGVPGFLGEAPKYNNRGLLETLKAANGINTGFEYDENGRLTHLSYKNQAEALKSYALKYDRANNIEYRNRDYFHYDYKNQLDRANLYGKFELDPEETVQRSGKTRSDFRGQKSLEYELEDIEVELDYAAGSIGVDLGGLYKVNRIELTPESPVHRIENQSNIRLYYCVTGYDTNYTRLDQGWKLAVKDQGKLEIVLDNPLLTVRAGDKMYKNGDKKM